MNSYDSIKQLILDTLTNRPSGTEIQPEAHQKMDLAILDYIKEVEAVTTSTLMGIAEVDTAPVQPDNSNVVYIGTILADSSKTYTNFKDSTGSSITVTTGDEESYLLAFIWNKSYWILNKIPTSVIANGDNQQIYYQLKSRKTYASYSDMTSDTSLIGSNGKIISIGEFVTVYNPSDTSKNGLYVRISGGWSFISGLSLGITSEINVDEKYPLTSGNYYTLSTAITAVETTLRAINAKITFTSAAGVQETYQYTNSDVANWLTVANWRRIIESNELNMDVLFPLANGYYSLTGTNKKVKVILTAGVTTNGNITLAGTTVAVTTGYSTAVLLAAYLATQTYTGYAVSYTSGNDYLELTANAIGYLDNPTIDFGSTGATGNITEEVTGTASAIATVPTQLQKEGISISFRESYTNEYCKYRLLSNWSTNPDMWYNILNTQKIINYTISSGIISGPALNVFSKKLYTGDLFTIFIEDNNNTINTLRVFQGNIITALSNLIATIVPNKEYILKMPTDGYVRIQFYIDGLVKDINNNVKGGDVSIIFNSDLKSQIEANESNIEANESNIEANESNIEANESNIEAKTKAQVYINSQGELYIEESKVNSIYFTSLSNQWAGRGAFNLNYTNAALASALDTPLVVSPKGRADCIELPDTYSFVINTITKLPCIKSRDSIISSDIVLLQCVEGRVRKISDLMGYYFVRQIAHLNEDIESWVQANVDHIVNDLSTEDGNSATIIFMTDLHNMAFSTTADAQTLCLDRWKRNILGIKAIDKLHNIDYCVLGGDYIWNNGNITTKILAENSYKTLQNSFYPLKEKVFALKGNHDDNTIVFSGSLNSKDNVIDDNLRYSFLGKQYQNAIINYGNSEKSYGYVDLPNKKLRLIFINSIDIPYIYNSDGTSIKYQGQYTTAIGNDQLNWIANALNFSEEGWGVMFFSHHALVNNSGINPSDASDAYVTSNHGGDAIWGIIKAFLNKTTFTITSSLTDFEYSVSVDYTNNKSNKIIACINGHTHEDLNGEEDNILLISTTAAGFGTTAKDSDGIQIDWVDKSVKEIAFDIFNIDRKNGKLHAYRYGAGQDRTFDLI